MKVFHTYNLAGEVLWQNFKEKNKPNLFKFSSTKDESILPFIVMLAFTIELGLKTLYFQKKNKWNRGSNHDLEKAFKKLNGKIQTHIKVKVCQERQIDNLSFDTLLKDNNKPFETWRYFFEKESVKTNVKFLQSFKKAILEELPI